MAEVLTQPAERGVDHRVLSRCDVLGLQPNRLVYRKLGVNQIVLRRTNKISVCFGDRRVPVRTEVELGPEHCDVKSENSCTSIAPASRIQRPRAIIRLAYL